jgi:RND family efflux transporter MFP subunit
MKISARFIAWTVAAICLAGLAYYLLTPRAKEVEVLQIQNAPAERVLAANGRLRPRLQVDVRPIVGGTLIALPFDVGDRVSEGQVIARIDDAPETAAIAEAEASVATQAATLAQARREYARFAALGEFVSKRDLEARRLDVTEGERELRRRQAAVTQAQETRDRRTLRAPFAGIILERPVDPGQTVAQDSILYRLADLSTPEASVEIDEIYAAEIKTGMAALINLSNSSKPINATVAFIQPRVDPATGARLVRLNLASTPADAPAGLTVTVNLLIEKRDSALSIPRSAILNNRGKSSVRILGSDGKVADRAITFLDWPSESVIITSGLKAGEQILLNPDAAAVGETVKAKAAQ